MQKVMAYRHSRQADGQNKEKEEVEIIDIKTENDTTVYHVKTQDGIKCTAIFNPFSCAYYADDIYGVIDEGSLSKSETEM